MVTRWTDSAPFILVCEPASSRTLKCCLLVCMVKEGAESVASRTECFRFELGLFSIKVRRCVVEIKLAKLVAVSTFQ